jgi:hypothetical protein
MSAGRRCPFYRPDGSCCLVRTSLALAHCGGQVAQCSQRLTPPHGQLAAWLLLAEIGALTALGLVFLSQL